MTVPLGGDDLSCGRPIFNVGDLRASERYYRDALGFKLDPEDGDPPDFASVSRGRARDQSSTYGGSTK